MFTTNKGGNYMEIIVTGAVEKNQRTKKALIEDMLDRECDSLFYETIDDYEVFDDYTEEQFEELKNRCVQFVKETKFKDLDVWFDPWYEDNRIGGYDYRFKVDVNI